MSVSAKSSGASRTTKRQRKSNPKPKSKKRVPLWTDAELAALELPDEISVSDWAEANRILDPLASAEPGPWRNDRTPYLTEIMDAFTDPAISEITLMKSTQVGGTEAMLNMIGYLIDQDPAPTMLVEPTEDLCATISQDRLTPMCNASPTLERHTGRSKAKVTVMAYRLDRMVMYLAGANSPSALGARPVRYLFCDETDKYPPFAGREADPISLAEERTRTFWNSKKVMVSTPTTRSGYITQAFERSDRRRFYVPCPECGTYQILHFRQVKWPEDQRDPEAIRREQCARYECCECENLWTDSQRQAAIRRGKWCPDGATINEHGEIENAPPVSSHAGFWLNCLYSPWLTASDVAAKFLESRDDPGKLMNFTNSWLGECWEEKTQESKPERLVLQTVQVPKGYVPPYAQVLVAAIDPHPYQGIYYVVRAYGPREESHLVREDIAESLPEAIENVLGIGYPFCTDIGEPDPSGKTAHVRLCCLDTSDNTDEMYEYCRGHAPQLRPIKGQDSIAGGSQFSVSYVDRDPVTGKPDKTGLALWRVDTNYFKTKVTRLANTPQADSRWHLHSDVSEEYLRQFCSEHKVIRRNRKTGKATEAWVPVPGQPKNHYFDCEVYAAAAADMLHVSLMKDPDNPEPRVYEAGTPEERQRGAARASGFLKRRKGWLRGR